MTVCRFCWFGVAVMILCVPRAGRTDDGESGETVFAVASVEGGISHSAALALALDASHMYVAGSDDEWGHDPAWRIEKRSLRDGVFDRKFGDRGVVRFNPSPGADRPNAVAVRGSHLYVAGSDQVAFDTQWRIEKRDRTSGVLVAEFGKGGIVTLNPSSASDEPLAIAADDHFLYVVGFAGPVGQTGWRIEKRALSNGMLDASFGSAGVVAGSGLGIARCIAIDAEAMYVAGAQAGPLYGTKGWRIEKRSLKDGALIVGFGKEGVINVDPGDGEAIAVAIDAQHLYVTGSQRDAAQGAKRARLLWRTEKRRLADGALVTSFGKGGVAHDERMCKGGPPSALVLDAQSLFIAGSTTGIDMESSHMWSIAKLSTSTGQPDRAFERRAFVGGRATRYPPGHAHTLALGGEHLYTVGEIYRGPDAMQWRMDKVCK